MKLASLITIVVLIVSGCAPLAASSVPSPTPTPQSTATPTVAPSATPTPSPTPISYGGGGTPLVAYIGGSGEAIELVIGDLFNNKAYYSVPLNRKFELNDRNYALWYGMMPLSWVPGGEQILFVDYCSADEEVETLSICLYDLKSQAVSEVANLNSRVWRIGPFSWSRDGQWVAYQTREDSQLFVSLRNLATEELIRLPNASNPKWGEDLKVYFTVGNNLSSWSNYNVENKVSNAMSMRCESREYRENRENWGCVGYVPELQASLMQQDNTYGSGALLLLINADGERIVCRCNGNFSYDLRMLSPDQQKLLLFHRSNNAIDNQQGTTVLNLTNMTETRSIRNNLHGIEWAPDSSSFFAYRDETSFFSKPLLLVEADSGDIIYEYQFPTSSWGIVETVGSYPSLDIYWPTESNEPMHA
jgi:hypothetical protein